MPSDEQAFPSVVTDAMRARIGVDGVPAEFEVTTSSVRAFARAVGYEDRVFYDRDEARRRGHRDLPAPPGYLGTIVSDPSWADTIWGRPEGFLPRMDTPYAQILNGGNDVEYSDEEICAGDLLTATAKVEGFNERYSAALGGPMLIQVTSITYKNQHGTMVAVMRNTSLSYGKKKES